MTLVDVSTFVQWKGPGFWADLWRLCVCGKKKKKGSLVCRFFNHLTNFRQDGRNWLVPSVQGPGNGLVERNGVCPGTLICKAVWEWVIFWETASGAAAKKVGRGYGVCWE